jgi:hypothetical protein
MIAVAAVAVLCWGTLRAHALERRAAFHAREKQECLVWAEGAEKFHQGYSCTTHEIRIYMEERYEAIPDLRERAAYHAELEAMYRLAARYPWIPPPTEKPFIPDDRNRTPGWLRARAEAFKSLERQRRDFANSAEDQRKPQHVADELRLADEDARRAADYERRARGIESLYGP